MIYEGKGEQFVREHNERAWMVFYIAAQIRAKKPLTLKKLQAKPKRREPQTWQQQLQAARMWTKLMGGKIVQGKAH